VPYSHSWQLGATYATQQQFYEVQLRPGITPAAVYRDAARARCYPCNPAAVLRGAAQAGRYPSSSFTEMLSSGRVLPQQQFNKVLSSDGSTLLQAKGEGVQAAVKQSGWTWWSWGQAVQAECRWCPSCC